MDTLPIDRAGLERLGYRVNAVSQKMLPLCNVTMKWGVSFSPPNQIDLYALDTSKSEIDPNQFIDLSGERSWYIGSAYPKKGLAGEITFLSVTLPKKFRFATDPVVSTGMGMHIKKLFKTFWELELPMRGVDNVGGFTSPREAWAKALQIEMNPALKKQLIKNVPIPVNDEV